MTESPDDILDDLFHGCAIAAYVELAVACRGVPDIEATRNRSRTTIQHMSDIESIKWSYRNNYREGRRPHRRITFARRSLDSVPSSAHRTSTARPARARTMEIECPGGTVIRLFLSAPESNRSQYFFAPSQNAFNVEPLS